MLDVKCKNGGHCVLNEIRKEHGIVDTEKLNGDETPCYACTRQLDSYNIIMDKHSPPVLSEEGAKENDGIPYEHIRIVQKQTQCTREVAIDALKLHNGDMVDAMIYIEDNR